MTLVALLRHGPTEWNAARRLQGRHDLPLSSAGRAAVASRRLPVTYRTWPVHVSPLKRARETAALLGLTDAVVAPGLTEMHWGDYEGRTVSELRETIAGFVEAEGRGLDFHPPGGESPREVRARVGHWLENDVTGEGVIGVTHKGVIRAAISLAFDWDMTGKAPAKLDWSRLHVFQFNGGILRPYALNTALE